MADLFRVPSQQIIILILENESLIRKNPGHQHIKTHRMNRVQFSDRDIHLVSELSANAYW